MELQTFGFVTESKLAEEAQDVVVKWSGPSSKIKSINEQQGIKLKRALLSLGVEKAETEEIKSKYESMPELKHLNMDYFAVAIYIYDLIVLRETTKKKDARDERDEKIAEILNSEDMDKFHEFLQTQLEIRSGTKNRTLTPEEIIARRNAQILLYIRKIELFTYTTTHTILFDNDHYDDDEEDEDDVDLI